MRARVQFHQFKLICNLQHSTACIDNYNHSFHLLLVNINKRLSQQPTLHKRKRIIKLVWQILTCQVMDLLEQPTIYIMLQLFQAMEANISKHPNEWLTTNMWINWILIEDPIILAMEWQLLFHQRLILRPNSLSR